MTFDVSVACSPDADDLFMMWALTEGHLATPGYRFHVQTVDTDGLNRLAEGDGPHVCALSTAWYPQVAARYQLLPHGGSMGEGYGPVVVARERLPLSSLADQPVAVPGLRTTAYHVLRLIAPISPVVIPITPYARIFDALRSGEVAAGLVIHEGRLTFEREGFVALVDIGEWWRDHTGGLPLPLGANAIRRDLGPARIAEISAILRASIRYGLDHRDAAIAWLAARGGALTSPESLDRYLGMYANERTFDCGPDGREAIARLLALAGHAVDVDFAP